MGRDTNRYCPECLYELVSGDGHYLCTNCNVELPYSDAIDGDDVYPAT